MLDNKKQFGQFIGTKGAVIATTLTLWYHFGIDYDPTKYHPTTIWMTNAIVWFIIWLITIFFLKLIVKYKFYKYKKQEDITKRKEGIRNTVLSIEAELDALNSIINDVSSDFNNRFGAP